MTDLSTGSSTNPSAELPSTALAEKIKAIRKLLIDCSLNYVPMDLSAERAQAVRSALLWLNEQSEYQTLGICADSLAEATEALKCYVAALSEPVQVDIEPQAGAVFLKFNTLKNTWYLNAYSGDSRGVLVTYHTSETELDAVNGTYGPFSLDLFDGDLG